MNFFSWKMMAKTLGFTLIELLIVIAIVAILSILAYPSYCHYLVKTHREEAKVALIQAQLKQTGLHVLNPSYSDDESLLGLQNNSYYIFNVVSATSTTYVIEAVAQSTQNKDTGCIVLTINQNSDKTPANCW